MQIIILIGLLLISLRWQESTAAPFNTTRPSAADISSETLTYLAQITRLAQASHCPKAFLTNWTCGICQTNSSLDATSNTTHVVFLTSPNPSLVGGYIGINHDLKTIIISLRGAIYVTDWLESFSKSRVSFCHISFDLNDLNLFELNPPLGSTEIKMSGGLLGSPPDIRLHSGFAEAWETARDVYFDHIKRYIQLYPDYDLTLTGYSFGAAVIAVAAFDLTMHLSDIIPPSRVNIVTVGGPRAGNRAFADYMNHVGFKRSYRLVHSVDPIPQIPKRDIIKPFDVHAHHYFHFGREIWMNPRQRAWVSCTQGSEDDDGVEEIDCMRTVHPLRFKIQAHVSYWNSLSSHVCQKGIDVSKINHFQYLPTYIVNQWYL